MATRAGEANGGLILPRLLEHPRAVAQRDLVLGPSLHRRPVRLQRDQIVADGGNLFDQVLAGRIVPPVNGVGWSAMPAILPSLRPPPVGQGSFITASNATRSM